MAGPTKAYIESELRATKRELDELKKKVQERVSEAIESGEICRSGGLDTLQLFGLNLPKATWSGYIDFRVYIENVKADHDTYGGIDYDDENVLALTDSLYTAIESAARGAKLPDDVKVTYIEQDNYDWTAE